MRFDADVTGEIHSNILFQRLVAKEVKFSKVDFKYTIFDNCYLRNCSFDSCDFTGSKFIGSQLPGSHFDGCKFDYCVFERTNIESEIMYSNAPPYENLKQKFARTLRINFQSIGDPQSVNKAIMFELAAKGEHLYKAWRSNESYYRNKYKGRHRVGHFFQWISFWILDFVWGNGESIPKYIRSLVLLWLLMAMVDYYHYHSNSFFLSFTSAINIFIGSVLPKNYSSIYISIIALCRFVSIGLFVSIVVKRFNRR